MLVKPHISLPVKMDSAEDKFEVYRQWGEDPTCRSVHSNDVDYLDAKLQKNVLHMKA